MEFQSKNIRSPIQIFWKQRTRVWYSLLYFSKFALELSNEQAVAQVADDDDEMEAEIWFSDNTSMIPPLSEISVQVNPKEACSGDENEEIKE